jgi:WD40 repeat protein
MRVYHILLISFVVTILVGRVTASSREPRISWTQLTDTAAVNVAMSPDGTRLIFTDRDSRAQTVLDWQTNAIVWQSPPVSAGRMHWSPDGRYIASVGGNITVVDVNSGETLSEVESVFQHTETALRLLTNSEAIGYSDIHWSADSQELAAMAYGYIVIYDFGLAEVTNIIDVIMAKTDRSYPSWFDWSPDGSRFAAFRYALEDGSVFFPIRITLGFWNARGEWQDEYDQQELSEQLCLPRSDSLFRGVAPIGSGIAWAPDSQTVAVSAGEITVCRLQDGGRLQVHHVFREGAAEQIFWSADQQWLHGLFYYCTLLLADAENNYRVYMEPVGNGDCDDSDSAGWSADGHYVAVGTSSGLWVGMIEYQ